MNVRRVAAPNPVDVEDPNAPTYPQMAPGTYQPPAKPLTTIDTVRAGPGQGSTATTPTAGVQLSGSSTTTSSPPHMPTTSPSMVPRASTRVPSSTPHAAAATVATRHYATEISTHDRDKGIVCLHFLQTDTCPVINCPYAHLSHNATLDVPSSRCSFYSDKRCLREKCVFFHGSGEAFRELKLSGAKTYNPTHYMPTRDPRRKLEAHERNLKACELPPGVPSGAITVATHPATVSPLPGSARATIPRPGPVGSSTPPPPTSSVGAPPFPTQPVTPATSGTTHAHHHHRHHHQHQQQPRSAEVVPYALPQRGAPLGSYVSSHSAYPHHHHHHHHHHHQHQHQHHVQPSSLVQSLVPPPPPLQLQQHRHIPNPAATMQPPHSHGPPAVHQHHPPLPYYSSPNYPLQVPQQPPPPPPPPPLPYPPPLLAAPPLAPLPPTAAAETTPSYTSGPPAGGVFPPPVLAPPPPVSGAYPMAGPPLSR